MEEGSTSVKNKYTRKAKSSSPNGEPLATPAREKMGMGSVTVMHTTATPRLLTPASEKMGVGK